MMDDNEPGIQIKAQLISGTIFCGNIRSFSYGWVRDFASANTWRRRRNANTDAQSNGYADAESGRYGQALCIEWR
jgi:hypothetical protein